MTYDPSVLEPLWRVVHERLSTGRPVAAVRVGPWPEEQREALADLLGLDRRPVEGTRIRLADLDRAVRGIDGRDLRTMLEAVLGPLEDRSAQHSAEAAERARLWDRTATHPLVVAEPALRDWIAWLRRRGLVDRSVPGTEALIENSLTVLAALPAGAVSLPVFADRTLSDPHALDDGRRLTTAVQRALSCLLGEGADGLSSRETWQRFGVDCDALSSTVLVAGVRATTQGSAGAVLTTAADHGQAAVLTLDQLRSAGDWSCAARVVHVVENPSVLASAAARFGPRCPPLVCVSGWPSAAAVLLLRALADAGAELRYHGDLDGDGLRIAAHVVARVGAVPWRMTTADYRAAVARRPTGPPAGRLTPVPWDADLAPAMASTGLAVTEESVLPDLLSDLAAATQKHGSDRRTD